MNRITIGKGEQVVELLGKYGNRHGLIAGATGTGKTISLLMLAEGFSHMGVPVFMADVKGDVSGLSQAGVLNERIQQRLQQLTITDYQTEASPVIFWDIYGEQGHPVRTTVSEMGPTLLARLLELNDTQTGLLDIVFKLADDRGLLLLDLDDLRAILNFASEHRQEISTEYGLISAQSVAAIQRSLLTLERDGGEHFFGEPALELTDLMRTDLSGKGVINILAADKLMLKPRMYSSFLLWLLSELFENLPEVGDPDVPKLVFFFDEAHLLFDDAPPSLLRQVEQVVRLIRSKGVGIYFCSQFPDDIPEKILGQLGNRIQHALRAFTPRDQKAVRVAAETFPVNPQVDVVQAITQLGVGEALVSTLQEKGVPLPVQQTLVAPPRCRMGAATSEERQQVMARSPVGAKYNSPVNRESAYELLAKKAEEKVHEASRVSHQTTKDPGEKSPVQSKFSELIWGTSRRQGLVESMAKQAARTVGSQVGTKLLRGVLGSLLGGK